MTKEKIAVVLLGAGKGSRMKSDLPKVMVPVCNKPMIRILIEELESMEVDEIVTVVAPDYTSVADAVAPHKTSIQRQQLGTGHAVMQAREHLDKFDGSIVVIFGDTPLVTKETILRAVEKRASEDYAVVVVGINPEVSPHYGRLVMENDELKRIVEFKDASEEERKIKMLNSGMMVLNGRVLFSLLEGLKNQNAAEEYYLTDVVELANNAGLKCSVVEASSEEMFGANTPEDLVLLEQYCRIIRK